MGHRTYQDQAMIWIKVEPKKASAEGLQKSAADREQKIRTVGGDKEKQSVAI